MKKLENKADELQKLHKNLEEAIRQTSTTFLFVNIIYLCYGTQGSCVIIKYTSNTVYCSAYTMTACISSSRSGPKDTSARLTHSFSNLNRPLAPPTRHAQWCWRVFISDDLSHSV